jgi:hypothetical protein
LIIKYLIVFFLNCPKRNPRIFEAKDVKIHFEASQSERLNEFSAFVSKIQDSVGLLDFVVSFLSRKKKSVLKALILHTFSGMKKSNKVLIIKGLSIHHFY